MYVYVCDMGGCESPFYGQMLSSLPPTIEQCLLSSNSMRLDNIAWLVLSETLNHELIMRREDGALNSHASHVV